MAKNDEAIVDHYKGASLQWRQITGGVVQSEICYLELRFHKKHKNMVLEQYFPHILSESKSMKEERKTLRIYTLKGDSIMRRHSDDSSWSSMKLDHPSTFPTLAMDTEMKKMIMDDLDMFSSLIAAMANYLNFDVYDLELAGICSNADLRKLLIKTGNRSILVVEDIDCSLNTVDDDRNRNKVVEEEDRALKMPKKSSNIVQKDDKFKSNSVHEQPQGSIGAGIAADGADGYGYAHSHVLLLAMCLAADYHGINDYHSLSDEIEGLLGAAMVTPAEVAKHLLRSDNVDVVLTGLIQFLQAKITETSQQDLMESAGDEQIIV
ncbi:hypothetical protein C2S53_016458 [Perilla frutescens var. hirtella]|uniref:AAA+ ATPase At3g28540-like C-terminal domain-containing protein n=1 Tax=Perilla frutescens var. hirtella TaxID=608512 RepID=A0AAD4IMA2_PERFH|nr:hypothetical protein C2S53_016458 [Perilla frutescens var. hirtella]